MFEITISTTKQKGKDISFIISKLRPVFKQLKGIMACEEFDGRVKLALAVKKDKKDIALSYIFDVVSEAIIFDYKEEFLKEHISMKNTNKVAIGTFIKVLTLFDKTSDKEIIKKVLKPSEEIFLDSLYLFRLWELEKRWNDLCKIIEDNAGYLQMDGTLFEMMKFIVATNEVEEGEVHLHEGENAIYAHNKDGRELFNMLYKEKDDNSRVCVLGELLSLSPEKIVVHNDVVDKELSNYIVSLFDNKVSVLK